MASKLGLHIHQPGPAVDAAIKAAPWAIVKSLGNTQPLQVARDAGIPVRVLRMYGVERLTPGGAVALWLGAALGYATHLQLVCEDQRGYDCDWQQAVIDGVRAGGYTGRFLVGGCATGNPATITVVGNDPHFPELEPIYPLLRRGDCDLALDEYSGILPTDPRWAQWAPYTSQRHRLIVADLARQGIAVRVLITESGGDSIPPVPSGGGWKTRGWGVGDYLGLLTALDAGDQADSSVLGRCIYTLNATADWAAFEIGGIIPALAAYVGSQVGTPPQSPQDGAGATKAPVPVVVTTEKGIGHMNPSPLFKFDQGPGTLDCWCECIRSFFLRYGYPLDLDTVFQAGKGKARPAGGEAATFAEVKRAVTTLANQLGVTLQTMDCDTPTVVFEALRDPDTGNPWSVIAGVAMQDLQPGQVYGHFMLLAGFRGGDEIAVVDSLDHYDGNTSGVYPASKLATAMIDNWEPAIDAEAVKIVGKAA